jgi:phosphatidylinositol alpha-mannosyltransferase
MKIGFVLDDSLDKPDGVQQYVLMLGNWLSVGGHEVHYLVGQTKRHDIANIHSLGTNVTVPFNGNKMSIPLPVRKRRIHQLLAQEKFDVLHIQMPYSPMLGARVINAAPPGTIMVGTFHILPYKAKERLATKLLRPLISRSLGRLDAIYSVSIPAQEFAYASLGVRSQVIPNSVDLKALKPKLQKQRGPISIVFLGRLVERKGCLELLKAIWQLDDKNVRVTICGDGPLRNKLEQYAQKKGLTILFKGFISEADKAKYLSQATIAVFPSLGGESFGIVLLEAMAAGAEVVLAGDNPGYAYVMNGRVSQLIQARDTAEFAQKLHHFISNPTARQEAYAWQQKRVKQFDINNVGQQILTQYQGIYKAKSAKRP